MERLAIEKGRPVRVKPWQFQYHGPDEIGELEKEYVIRVLESRKMFRYLNKRADSFTARLEQFYKDRLGVPYALAVNGGTSALKCALAAAGIGPGDEVIVPAYTFIATAAAVVAARAVPVIVECDDTLNIDPQAFAAAITPYTKAVIPVHMRGVMAQMNEIQSIAAARGILVIEDVAQANGGAYFGRQLGSIGDFGCFSFQHYKVITSGEGGLVVTGKEEWHTRASHQHDSAYQFWGGNDSTLSIPGENYRMSELNGALGYAQAQKLDGLLGRLRGNKSRIVAGIRDIRGLTLQRVVDPAGDCGTSIAFFLPDKKLAAGFSSALSAEGIPNGTVDNGGVADRHIYRNWDYILQKRMASPAGTPWNCAEYKGAATYHPDMCPITLDYLARAISIGIQQNMGPEDCDDVVEAVAKVASALL